MKLEIIVIAVIGLILLLGFLWYSRKAPAPTWEGDPTFIASSGLAGLGGIVKGNKLTLMIALGATGASDATLCVQDYEIGAAIDANAKTPGPGTTKITTRFLTSYVAQGSDPAGQLLDDGDYDCTWTSSELILYDDNSVYLHLVPAD